MKSTDKFVLVLVASLALLLAGCGGGSSTPPPTNPGPTAGEMAIEQAQMALTNAQAGVSSDMTDMQMAAAYRAIENAANNLVTALTTHGGSSAEIAAAARTGGEAKAMAESLDMKIAEAQKAADMEMMAVAAKLYAGIDAPLGDANSAAATDRAAAYNNAGTAPLDTADTHILVSIGNGTDVPTAVALSEDKKTMVAANHGWAGKRYTRTTPATDGMYEAVVYSNVGAPMQGKKFGGAAAGEEFEYALTSGVTDPAAVVQNGEIAMTTAGTGLAAAADIWEKVALPGVTLTAGTETFKFAESDVTGRRIDVPGSFHVISGTYYCTPTTRASGCSASVAASGFTLAGGDWVFKPSDPNARVMDSPDTAYASYGWWIHKSADGETFTASAFADEKGTTGTAVDGTILTALQGTATYMGGAAGKYALSSATGGTNDAGHFTARATLEADFGDGTATGTITGTIDNFMGADGMARDWSVGLKEATIVDNSTPPGAFANADAGTVWTIGETAASASGEWSGSLLNQGTDNVPEVATGTFYTEYGMDGKMVGAFGVNKE